MFTGIRIPFITISYFTFLFCFFFWTCIRLSYVLSVLLYSVCIGPTACLHRYLLPIIAGTNTAFYLMVLLPIRGDFLYVFSCVILFLCTLVLLVLRLPRLGKREQILVLSVRLFDLCLFGFVGFLFLLGSGKGYGLWLWHSLDFSLTYFFFFFFFFFFFWLCTIHSNKTT